MQEHTKIYADFFGYQVPEDFVCELTGGQAVDIHHIKARGMGGNPLGDKDKIENLMAMNREDHDKYGDDTECRPLLRLIHLKFMKYNGIPSKVALLDPPIDEQIRLAEIEANQNVDGGNVYNVKP